MRCSLRIAFIPPGLRFWERENRWRGIQTCHHPCFWQVQNRISRIVSLPEIGQGLVLFGIGSRWGNPRSAPASGRSRPSIAVRSADDFLTTGSGGFLQYGVSYRRYLTTQATGRGPQTGTNAGIFRGLRDLNWMTNPAFQSRAFPYPAAGKPSDPVRFRFSARGPPTSPARFPSRLLDPNRLFP